jgi:hypothetical protein
VELSLGRTPRRPLPGRAALVRVSRRSAQTSIRGLVAPGGAQHDDQLIVVSQLVHDPPLLLVDTHSQPPRMVRALELPYPRRPGLGRKRADHSPKRQHLGPEQPPRLALGSRRQDDPIWHPLSQGRTRRAPRSPCGRRRRPRRVPRPPRTPPAPRRRLRGPRRPLSGRWRVVRPSGSRSRAGSVDATSARSCVADRRLQNQSQMIGTPKIETAVRSIDGLGFADGNRAGRRGVAAYHDPVAVGMRDAPQQIRHESMTRSVSPGSPRASAPPAGTRRRCGTRGPAPHRRRACPPPTATHSPACADGTGTSKVKRP